MQFEIKLQDWELTQYWALLYSVGQITEEFVLFGFYSEK